MQRFLISIESIRARRDDSFYFRPTAPHRIVNAGKSVCRVIWVSTPPSF